MLLFPNCKINLGLRVLFRRDDGYHELETLFYPVHGLHDELEVLADDAPEQQIMFQADGLAVDCAAEDNLIVRCYRRMAARYPQVGSVRVRFTKHIPFGAGLGGGSSDAAHMAVALNTLFRLNLSREQLCEEVRPLGADCPFFIYNTPCMARGIGEILCPLRVDLRGKRLVMIKPAVGVSTREAYAGIMQRAPHTCSYSDGWQAVGNDFEQTVFPLHPELAHIKQRLLEAGAFYAAMSGSGSTLFGLFEQDAEGGADARLRALYEDFAPMILFNDTLGEA